MNLVKTIFILSFLLSISKSDTFNYPFIIDYLQWKNLDVILFVTCERKGWINKTVGYIQNNSIWINHYDISNDKDVSKIDYERYFVRLEYPLLVVVNFECNYTENFLTEISKRKMFHFERNWLIIGKSAERMFNVLSKENINVDAEIGMAVPVRENLLSISTDRSSREYQINDVYNPSHARNGRFQMVNIGMWNEKLGLRMNEMETKFERRRDFGGITFLAGITIPTLPTNKTFMDHINSDEQPYLDSMSKNNYRIFQLLMQMYNFKMSIRRTKIWGALQPNGHWLGVVGLMNRSEIDICISGLRWEDERYGAFDQTTNSFYVQIVFIFRHPKKVDATNVFLTPFDTLVWSLIIALGVVASVAVKQFFSMEQNFGKIVHCLGNKKNESSFGDSFLMVFGYFFQQGYWENPLLISSRILTSTILLFSLCIYQFYSSFIVGSLLTEPPKTIKTIKQLLHSKLEIAVDEVPYVLDNFQRVKEESAVQLYNTVISQPSPFMPLYSGLNMVKKGSFAFHTDGSYAYKILKSTLTDKEACDLQEVKYVPEIPTGPGLPKKSPFKEMVKIGIRKIYETGILAHQWKIWIGHLPQCENSKVDVVPVDITHFSSALYLLAFGIQISAVIFIGELAVVYCLDLWGSSKYSKAFGRTIKKFVR